MNLPTCVEQFGQLPLPLPLLAAIITSLEVGASPQGGPFGLSDSMYTLSCGVKP